MGRGISSKIVDSGNRQRVGVLEDWDFVDAAPVWLQDGESVGLTPAKAIFQQIVLFRMGRFEQRGSGSEKEVQTHCAPFLLDFLAPAVVPQLKHSVSFKQTEVTKVIGQKGASVAGFTAQTRN